MSVRVQGGTNAGCKKPLGPRRTERWLCFCEGREDLDRILRRSNPPYLARCADCGAFRP